MFSPLSRWLADGLADLNIDSAPPGMGKQDHAAAEEVMGVLPFLLAALSASMIETASSAMLLQADAWARDCAGAAYLLFQFYHPYSGSAGGVVLELAVMDGLSGQGRAEGWDTSSCRRGRLGAAQLLRRRLVVEKEVGTASLEPWRAPLAEETQKTERCFICPLSL